VFAVCTDKNGNACRRWEALSDTTVIADAHALSLVNGP
jgi:hypothetical protein